MCAIVAKNSGAQIVLHTPVLVSHGGRSARSGLPA
jgi:hypothetical protein